MKARSHCMMWIRTDAHFLVSLGQYCWIKWTGLNWDFVSCYTSLCQSMSHELAKSWGDVVIWAAFETPFFPCSGSTKAVNDCLFAEPWAYRQVNCTPFPPGVGAIAPGQLQAWCCPYRRKHWLPKHHFNPEHCQALQGKAGGTQKYPMICGLPAEPLWIEAGFAPWAHTERGHPSFCWKQQNDNSLVS